MQTLQHRAIFVNKVSFTMLLIPENNENKTTRIECLTSHKKVMGKVLDFRDGEITIRYEMLF